MKPAANSFLSELAAHNAQLSKQLLSAPLIVLFAVTANSFEVHQLKLDPNLLVPIADGQTMPRVPLTERKLTWLYQQLMMPVAHMVADKRVVHIIPHGPLHALPFAALRNRAAHRCSKSMAQRLCMRPAPRFSPPALRNSRHPMAARWCWATTITVLRRSGSQNQKHAWLGSLLPAIHSLALRPSPPTYSLPARNFVTSTLPGMLFSSPMTP